MIPVLELCDEADVDGIAALREACHATGCFYLRGAVAEDVCGRVAAAALGFFREAPADEKAAISYEKSSAFRGYMALGKEVTHGTVDAREQIELGPDEDPDATLVGRLRGRNQWPDGAVRAATEAWLDKCRSVAERLVRLLALALGLRADGLDAVLGRRPHWQAKLSFYPTCAVQGVGKHTDSGVVTLLWQDGPGLEVQLRSGEWIAAEPLPGTLVCNLGEMLQLASGGYFRATPHRVASPRAARLSLPYFFNPSLDSVVDVVLDQTQLDALPWHHPRCGYDTDDAHNHRVMNSYGRNAFKYFARSHPHVFERHHPDLTFRNEDGAIFLNS